MVDESNYDFSDSHSEKNIDCEDSNEPNEPNDHIHERSDIT